MKIWVRLGALALVSIASGCVRKPATAATPVIFRNCRVTSKDSTGTAVSCDCRHFEVAVNAHTHQREFLCKGSDSNSTATNERKQP